MNVQSLESVIDFLVRTTEERVAAARAQVDEKSDMEIHDLEEEKSPEMVMLSSTTSENALDRTQR